MKIKHHENTGMVYIATETPDDHFKIGKLSERLRGSIVHCNNGVRELQTSMVDLLEALLKP